MKRRNPWATLTVLALAQFMVVLDVTIVNVALPNLQADLHFSANNLQWVISAYTLLFGGFLLLGGRAADLLGRRLLFMLGLGLFGVTSLAAGLVSSPDALIFLRAVQGFGGAMLSPAALSILTVTFAHGRERNIAMGVWGGLAGLGGTLGVIAGGVLVDELSWRWVFFVNVPIAIALVLVSPIYIAESRVVTAGQTPANNDTQAAGQTPANSDTRAAGSTATGRVAHGATTPRSVGSIATANRTVTATSPTPARTRRTFDVAGGILGTGGLLAIVYGVIQADPLGWSSGEVIGFLVGGIALLIGFVIAESRSSAPLVPLELFKSRGLSVSSGALALNGAAFLAMFFLTAIFLQQVRHLSPLKTGVEFLPMGFAAVAAAVVASQLVTKVGTRPVQAGAAIFGVVGLLLLSRAGATGSYAAGVMPGLILFGIGIVGLAVPAQVAAIADVGHDHAGAASGVVTAGYQVGGALGLAVITTLSTSHVNHLLATGASTQDALVGGFHRGLLIAALFAAVNVLVAFGSPRLRPSAEQMAEAVPA